MAYDADFYDRDGALLRCRSCGFLIDHLDADYLDRHVSEHIPCPGCALDSRIPTAEEGEWPNRKHPHDPIAGVSTVADERRPRGAPLTPPDDSPFRIPEGEIGPQGEGRA